MLRTYKNAIPTDSVIDFVFTPASMNDRWGIYARLDSVESTPRQVDQILTEQLGVNARYYANDYGGTNSIAAEYSPLTTVPDYKLETHHMRLSLRGKDLNLYLDNMDTPLVSTQANKETGSYFGFYTSATVGAIVHYVSVNGNVVLGTDKAPDAVYRVATSVKNSEGGLIGPENPQIPMGENQVFTLNPKPGYDLKNLYLDGQPVPFSKINFIESSMKNYCSYTYTMENVNAEHTLEAEYTLRELGGDYEFDLNWYQCSVANLEFEESDHDSWKVKGSSGWLTYLEPTSADVVIDFSFTPSDPEVMWGIYARMDCPEATPEIAPEEMLFENTAIHSRFYGASQGVASGFQPLVPIEGYAAGVPHLMRMRLQGSDCNLYLDDMTTPILSYQVSKTDGEYVGMMIFGNATDSVINYFKVNGKCLLGESVDGAFVTSLISALPAVDALSLENSADVSAARSYYDRLNNEEKANVANLAVLEAAEAKIAALKEEADKIAADAVKAQIASLPQKDTVCLEDEAAILQARSAFDELSSSQKQLVDNIDTLSLLEQRILELKAEAKDKAAADAVKAQIAALPASSTPADKDALLPQEQLLML